jgi:hypothetical protein
MTVADLTRKGARALSTEQLKTLVVGKAFWLRNSVTGEQFSQNFTTDGNVIVFRVGTSDTTPSYQGNLVRDGYEGATSRYTIESGKLVTVVAQEPYAVTVHRLGNTYYAARSNEFGYANYEIIPAPQIAVNPLTEIGNQFSIELGLTEEQKQQVLPVLNDELKQLEALKKNTSLSGVKKVEQLRAIGVSFDQKISPLLSGEQQPKFQALRERVRRRMLDQMASEAAAKLKGVAARDLETLKKDAEGVWLGR